MGISNIMKICNKIDQLRRKKQKQNETKCVNGDTCLHPSTWEVEEDQALWVQGYTSL